MVAQSTASMDQRRVLELAQAAIELPEEERLAFIDQACIDAPQLRRWVESLMPSDLENTAFLPRHPNAEVQLPEPPTSGLAAGRASGLASGLPSGLAAVPSFIGPYRLLEVLGEGGMGTVYLAQQDQPVERQVAVKVARARPHQRKLMHRFEVERQALARMSHPNIAQVFEAGDLADGRPYFVMEHLPGVTLLRYCNRGNLGIERRLELFLDVCAGIHHAHQKGVVHRDIKPENVLVTEQGGMGVPKIIDFGIAKALDVTVADPSLHTGDVLLGTPAFLSPELWNQSGEERLPADVRSDVYALGILLYILLVGELPFERQEESFLGFMQRMADFQAPPPSERFETLPSRDRWQIANQRDATPLSLTRRLQGDLDRIVLKAIARKREKRYASAAELADDLRRHLADEPVGARRASSWRFQWLRRWRRHPVAAMVTVMLVTGLVSGTGVYYYQNPSSHPRASTQRAAAAVASDFASLEAGTEEALRSALELLRVRADATSSAAVSSTAASPDTAASNIAQLHRLLNSDATASQLGSNGDPVLRFEYWLTLGELCLDAGLPERGQELLSRAVQLSASIPELSEQLKNRAIRALERSRRQLAARSNSPSPASN